MSAGGWHLAVDVGTSRTTAAVARVSEADIVVRAIRLGQNADAASSAVFITADRIIHGDAAERRGIGEPERLLRETKRRIGDAVPLIAGGSAFAAEELLADTVAWVADTVTSGEGPQIDAVTVTVPAAWGEQRRRGVAAALAAAGLPDVRLLAEPVAAAGHYAATHDLEPGGILAVYDLGAGTFDLALVRHDEDEDAVILAAGLDDLGGADFDDDVIAHVRESAPASLAVAGDALSSAALRRECVAAKEALSFDPEATIPLLMGAGSVRLARDEFETMIEARIGRTIAALTAACARAGVDPATLDGILLSGGSSRIPRVAQMLSDAFDVPLRVDADPKAVVALGAARLGAVREAAAARPAVAAVPAAEAATPLAMPPRWRVLLATTAAAAAVVGGCAVTSAVAASVGGETVTTIAAAEPIEPFVPVAGAPAIPVPPATTPASAPPETPTPGATAPETTTPGTTPRTTPRQATPAPRNPLRTPRGPQLGTGEAPLPPASSMTSPSGGGVTPASTSPSTTSPSPPPSPTAEPEIPVIVPDPEPTPEPEPTTEPEPEPTTEPQPDPEPTTEPQPDPEPTTAPQPDPEPVPDPQPSGDPEPAPDPGDGGMSAM
ncbi:Hsp70 family protein [Microbacterium aurum]